MSVLFYGDPHRVEAVSRARPEHVVLIGDLELDRPLKEKMASVIASGARVWWIVGNHDTHSEEQHDFLFADHPEGNLGGRVVELECSGGTVVVGGLGGVYRRKVWMPGGEPARYQTRADYIRLMGRSNRWRDGLPLRQRDTIFPEDHASLARLRCDVLVAHEAPSTHIHGFQVIDELAEAMEAKLIVHGHHHDSYSVETGGIRVRGLGEAEALVIEAGASLIDTDV
jgi:predicted phosphodiesterase